MIKLKIDFGFFGKYFLKKDKTYINRMMLNPSPKEIIPNKEKAFSKPIDFPSYAGHI